MCAAKNPDLFKGLMLIHPRCGVLSPLELRIKLAYYEKISRLTDDEFMSMICSPGFFANQEANLTEDEKKLLISEIITTSRSNFLQQLKLSLEYTLPDYPRILTKMPISMILGTSDKITPSSRWDKSDLFKNTSTKHAVNWIRCASGHLSILKYPELIATELADIIAGKINHAKLSPLDDEQKHTRPI